MVIQSIYKRRRKHSRDDIISPSNPDNKFLHNTQNMKAIVVLGSGGHTTEMIHLLEQLDPRLYAPVVYVVANSDSTSVARLKKYIDEVDNSTRTTNNDAIIDRWKGRYPIENVIPSENKISKLTNRTRGSAQMAPVHRLPRPREVHQSYISSILPTLRSIYHTFYLLQEEQPDLILANGPGMCVPLMYLTFLSRLLGLTSCRMVFVESLCRVKTLSLSGKLVYPIVDQFVVHWPSLKAKYSLANLCDVFIGHEDD